MNFNCGGYVGYPSLPTCGIVGPDTVCTAGSYWDNASVTNEDSRYTYTYAWTVDSNNVGSGKSIQVNWAGYTGGSHALNITQTEKYGSTTTYSALSTVSVFVVPKPTAVITIGT